MPNVRDTTRMFSRTQMVTTTSTTSTTPLVEGQDVVVKAKDGTMLIDSPKYGQKLEQSGFKIVNSDDSDKERVKILKIPKITLYKQNDVLIKIPYLWSFWKFLSHVKSRVRSRVSSGSFLTCKLTWQKCKMTVNIEIYFNHIKKTNEISIDTRIEMAAEEVEQPDWLPDVSFLILIFCKPNLFFSK